MDQKDFQEDSIIFKSNEDILDRYGELFDNYYANGEDYYIERENDLENIDAFRFFITPSGLIEISSSAGIPGDYRDVWDLDFQNRIVKRFLVFLNVFVSERKENTELRNLQGAIPYSKGYTFRIYTYNNRRDSEIVKEILDERRMGYILSRFTQE